MCSGDGCGRGELGTARLRLLGRPGSRKGTPGNPRSLSFFSGPWEEEGQRGERPCSPELGAGALPSSREWAGSVPGSWEASSKGPAFPGEQGGLLLEAGPCTPGEMMPVG